MNAIKGIMLACIVSLLWSGSCFFAGWLFCNRRTAEQLDRANQQITEQQRKYDEFIRDTEERIRLANERLSSIREELSGKVADNGKTSEELSKLIEQIKGQRIDL